MRKVVEEARFELTKFVRTLPLRGSPFDRFGTPQRQYYCLISWESGIRIHEVR